MLVRMEETEQMDYLVIGVRLVLMVPRVPRVLWETLEK